MAITTLPNDLTSFTTPGLQLYNYKTFTDIQNTKINLAKHTISFHRTGIKEVIGGDKLVQIDQRQFVIMKSGNCLMTEKVSSRQSYYQSILLFFTDQQLLDFIEKHPQHSRRRGPSKKSFYVFDYDNYLQNFIVGLENILALPRLTQEKLLGAKFEELMVYLTTQVDPDFLDGFLAPNTDQSSRLISVVEHNKFNKLSLTELAFLANMSVSTFKRSFFKNYGKTPIRWFHEQRMRHSAFLLKSKIRRPIDVYQEAGYDNFSNFVQAFKKEFGQTPKQYQSSF